MQLQGLFKIFIATALIMIVGCGEGGSSFSLLSDSDNFIQSNSGVNNKVDILFIINSEPSMSAFQDELAASFSTFMQVFESKGFDFKIAVATSSGYMADITLNGYDPINIDAADFNHFDGTNDSQSPVLLPSNTNLIANFEINSHPIKNTAGQDGRSFSSMRQALMSTRPINIGFARPDAFLAVIIVDNQDDFSDNDRCTGCSVNLKYNNPTLDPVQEYVNFLDSYTNSSTANRKYNVSAMTQIASPCQGGTNMTRIMELANATNGVLGDICEADFGQSMLSISNQIATLSTQFLLDRVPIPSSISVTVNGADVPNDEVNGWTYNATANSIEFNGSSIPATGSVIHVDYDPVSYGS